MSDLTLQERYDFQVDANRSLVEACGKAMDLKDKAEAEIERLRAVITRAKDALLDGQSTQWVHDLLVSALLEGK